MPDAQNPVEVFYSYAPADKHLLERLDKHLSLLRRQELISTWHDRLLVPGTDWAHEIDTHLNSASVILLLISPDFLASDYKYGIEMQRALERQRAGEARVIPILVRPVDWSGAPFAHLRVLPTEAKPITIWKNKDAAFADVATGIRSAIIDLSVLAASDRNIPFKIPEEDPLNPYKGLQPFRSEDAHLFFGRDSLIEDLLERLQPLLATDQQNHSPRLLTIFGPSGSGKSSVVMAGLLPQLQQGALSGSQEWIFLEPMRPELDPLGNLALTLSALFPQRGLESLREDLMGTHARGLHLLAMQGKQSKSIMLLIIDQFEELFSQKVNEETRRHFIHLLLTAATEPRGPLVIVLTLRADFYGKSFAYPELGRLIEAHHVPVYPMEPSDLRSAIERPANLPDIQLEFEKRLVDDMLLDAQGQVGALPLLEFTLDQLFRLRQGRLLTRQAYQSLGGISGALTHRAEAVYQSLPDQTHRRFARALFLRLINPGTFEQDVTRRRVPLSELIMTDPGKTALLAQVTDAFVKARLLTANTIGEVYTVEVSHEALIHVWKRVQIWLQEAETKEDLRIQQIISHDARKWLEDEEHLYAGAQLRKAREWRERNIPSRDEDLFLNASEQRQKKTLARRTFLVIGTLVVAGGGSFAFNRLLFPPPPSPPRSHPSLPFVLSGHTDVVTSAAWSPNNQWLATSSYDDTARIWSASTGELLHILSGHTNFVLSVIWSPNSQWVATASFDNTARIWSASTGKLLHILSGQSNAVSSVAWSPNGQWLATSSYDFSAQIWDATAGKLLHILEHPRSVSGITWSPDGQWLATSNDDGQVRIWNAVGHLLHALNGSSENIPIGRIAWSPNSQWLAIASDDMAYVWNAITGATLQIPSSQTRSVTRVAWSPDSQWLATSDSRDNSTGLWNIITGLSGPTFREHTAYITQIAWSPNSQWLAIASKDKTALIADAITGEPLYLFRGHQNAINTIAWSPSGQWLATASDDHTARVWERLPDPLLRYSDHTGPVSGATWSPSGQWVATHSEDNTARIWDAVSGQTLRIFDGHTSTFTNITWSPNGLLLATSSEDGTARIWDAVSGQALQILNSHMASMDNVTWAPDGQRVATCSSDGNLLSTASVWDAVSGRLLHILNDHPAFITVIVWSPNGQWLATPSDNGTVRIWNASSGQLLHILNGHTRTVFCVAWSPNGQWLATGSDDGTARIWNASTGELVFILTGPTDMIRSIVWSPNGQWLATGSDDGTARIWNAFSGQTRFVLKSSLESVKSVTGVMNVAWSPDGRWLASSHRDGTAWIWNTSTGRPFHVLRSHTNIVNTVVWSPTGQRLATSSADSTACIWFLA